MPNWVFSACLSFACHPCLLLSLPSTFKLAVEEERKDGRKKGVKKKEIFFLFSWILSSKGILKSRDFPAAGFFSSVFFFVRRVFFLRFRLPGLRCCRRRRRRRRPGLRCAPPLSSSAAAAAAVARCYYAGDVSIFSSLSRSLLLFFFFSLLFKSDSPAGQSDFLFILSVADISPSFVSSVF